MIRIMVNFIYVGMWSEMQAIMLAAGKGSRLGKYTKNNTKCMLDVHGKTVNN